MDQSILVSIAMSLRSPLLNLQNIQKYYRVQNEPLPILKEVNLTLNSAQSMALTGPSGSGKSTLIHLIAGTDLPSQGKLVWRGQDLTNLSDTQRSKWRLRELGLIFQDFRLFPHLNALENIALPLELLGQSAKESQKKAYTLLDEVGLADRATHTPHQLSGGEKQRIALARALIHQPALILADEPTGNLDYQTAQQVLSLLFDLCKHHQTALFLVTHNPNHARLTDVHAQIIGGRLQVHSQSTLVDQRED